MVDHGKMDEVESCMIEAEKDNHKCREKCKPECEEWKYNPIISYGGLEEEEYEAAAEAFRRKGFKEHANLGPHIHLEMGYPALEYTMVEYVLQ